MDLLLSTLRSLRAHALRFFLTSLGIVWGAFLLTFLSSSMQGLDQHFTRELEEAGPKFVIAWPGTVVKHRVGERGARAVELEREDMERLLSYQTVYPPGPYLVDSTFFLVLSNLAWLTELLVAVLLFIPRTRPVGVLAGLSTMIAIEFIAREFVFGLLMAALICLFARGDLNRRLLPIYLSIMVVMLGIRLEWLPAMRWN